MAQHEIHPDPKTVHWGYFDGTLEPVMAIDPGDTIVVHSVSGSRDALPTEADFTIRPNQRAIVDQLAPQLGPHILTGPIAVRGAEPGDALRVEILDVQLGEDWGYNQIRPGAGALPEDFPYAKLLHVRIDKEGRMLHMPWGMAVPASPFFGVMGVAPDPSVGRISSVAPGSFGGNIDNKELGAGAVLYLPVAVPGGLFSAGDGHAAQGDGEVCLTAVETGLTGTLRIDVVKAANLEAPYAETPTHLIAMAFDEDLNEAVKIALRRMIAMIAERTGISAENAYRLCSVACDLHVTQVVNRKKGIHAMLPLSLLKPAG